MSGLVRWSGAACVVAMSLLTGCSSAVNGVPTEPGSSSSMPRTSASEQTGATLQEIAVQARDLSLGYTARLVPAGDRVKGQVTLDNCGFNFTTEKDRVARRQYEVLNAASADTGLSNEVVAYDAAAHAAKALRQWHVAAARCPRGLVRSRVAAEPKMRIKVKLNQLDQANLPVPANALTMESMRARSVGKLYCVAILQVRGRYLDAVYGTSPHPLTPAEVGTVERLASITGQRLAGVP